MRLASILTPLFLSASAGLLAASCAAPVVTTPTTGGDAGKADGGRVPAGECGTCPVGAKCVQGACQCPSGQMECGDACVDTRTDTKNCGACGKACGADAGGGGGAWACVTGSCTLTCSGTKQACGGSCVDTQADTNHCGACGTACSGGQQCCTGSCASTQTDPQHCGSCTTACSGGASDCCGGSCVNKLTDRNNCGACGNVCAGTSPCTNGKCCQTPTQGACGSSLCQPSFNPMTFGCDGVQGCVNKVCLQDSYCCTFEWDSACVQEVDQFCAPLKCVCN
jgi:hypothetical protein